MSRWSALVLSVCLAFAFARPALADEASEPATPDTPAGRMLRDWLDTFNAGDRGGIEAFRSTHNVEESVDETLTYRDFSGGLDLRSIDARTPYALDATLRERDAALADVRIALELDEARPSRIARLSIERGEIARQSEAQALQGLRTHVERLAADGRFSGAYLVARHGIILQQGHYGLADRERGTPITADTRFRFASLGKMFTSVAVLQLIDAGKLSLDGTVGDYLPDYPNRDVASTVRIRHLLAHTGGVGDIGFWDSPEFAEPGRFIAYRERMRTHSDLVAQHANQPLAFAPGTQMAYSNFGYVLLGHIIERVDRSRFEDAIRKRVFAPAGMRATGYSPESKRVRDLAVSYTLREGRWENNRDLLPYRGNAAGGGYTTIADLLNFARALESGALLSKARLADATRAQSAVGWYGFGFVVVGQGPLRRYGHSGDFPGTNADVRIFPESGYVLIALSNIDPPASYRLFRYLEPRMPLE